MRLRLFQKGFTLVELLVTTLIIGLVSTFVFVNFRGGNDALALQRSAQLVIQDVRRAAELALQAEQAVTCGSGALSGYGIHFDSGTPTSYIIFAECSGSAQSDAYDAGEDEIFRTVTLERNIEILQIDPVDPLSIIFVPPDPSVSFSDGVASGTIVVGISGTAIGYEYRLTGDIAGWPSVPPNYRASCDTTPPPNNPQPPQCSASFPASIGDPQLVHDRYCMPTCALANRRSQVFTKSFISGLRGIFINEVGFPDLQ